MDTIGHNGQINVHSPALAFARALALNIIPAFLGKGMGKGKGREKIIQDIK